MNAQTKHTPGPWTFEELRGDDGLGYIASDHADVPCGHIIHAGVSDLPAEENRANAHLIAAAPDLLTALKEVSEWIGGWSPNFEQDDEWPETAKRMRDAIAKATQP